MSCILSMATNSQGNFCWNECWMTVVDITNARGDVVCVSGILSHTHKRRRVYDEVATAGATYCRSHTIHFSLLFSDDLLWCVIGWAIWQTLSATEAVLPALVGEGAEWNMESFFFSLFLFQFNFDFLSFESEFSIRWRIRRFPARNKLIEYRRRKSRGQKPTTRWSTTHPIHSIANVLPEFATDEYSSGQLTQPIRYRLASQ